MTNLVNSHRFGVIAPYGGTNLVTNSNDVTETSPLENESPRSETDETTNVNEEKPNTAEA